MKELQTIGDVVEQHLCHSCGTCAGICPRGAIAMIESPSGFLVAKIDNEQCTRCGLCVRVCPGWHLIPGTLAADVDPLKGSVLKAFQVRATDRNVLQASQSGGAVTAVLTHMMTSGQIDSALLARMPDDGTLRPEPVEVATPEDVLACCGSLYCPMPTCKLIGTEAGNRGRRAFVGVSCQVHGLRNTLAALPAATCEPPLVIGLVCAGHLSYFQMEYLARAVGVPRCQVQSLRFRDKHLHGWPGEVTVRTVDGRDHAVSRRERLLSKPVFEALRCRLCFDQMNVLSDLVVGDPWGMCRDPEGLSVVLARTDRGLAALTGAEAAGHVTLEEVSVDDIFRGQTVDVRHRRDWSALTSAWQSMGHLAPDFGIDPKWMSPEAEFDLRVSRRRLAWLLEIASCPTTDAVWALANRRLKRERMKASLLRLRRVWSILKRLVPGRRRHRVGVENRNRNRSRTMRIALIGARLSMNLGGPSLLAGTLKALKQHLPEATFTLISRAEDEQQEESLATGYGLEYIPERHFSRKAFLSAMLGRRLGRSVGSVATQSAMRHLRDVDAVIDIWGICFADSGTRNTFRGRVGRKRLWLMAKMLGKPMIKYTAAIGPCRAFWNRFFARFYLGRCCDAILARDEQSLDVVKRLRISTESMSVPDSAFLFEPSASDASERTALVARDRPVIGLSISYQAYNRAESPEAYVELMGSLVRHMVNACGAYVMILPNEMSHGQHDDRRVAAEVLEAANSSQCEVLNVDSLRAEELKGVIKECAAVIAARYHTIVASLSLGVPVVAIAWHHKYAEVLGLFGQEQYLCNVADATLDDVTTLVDRLWENRDAVRAKILERLPGVQDRVHAAAERVCELITTRQR